jgi:hypothetical protein
MKKAFVIILCFLVISGLFLSIFNIQTNKNIKKSYIKEKNNIICFNKKNNRISSNKTRLNTIKFIWRRRYHAKRCIIS